MGSIVSVVALVLAIALVSPVFAGEPLLVVEQTRTSRSGRAARHLEHVATVTNVSPGTVRAVRVTVEAKDRSGRVLWKRVKRGPSTLAPGESTSISVTAPDLGPDATLVYHLDAGGEKRRPRSR